MKTEFAKLSPGQTFKYNNANYVCTGRNFAVRLGRTLRVRQGKKSYRKAFKPTTLVEPNTIYMLSAEQLSEIIERQIEEREKYKQFLKQQAERVDW